MATRKENSLKGLIKENSYMSFERTLQTHRTFQWRFVYCLIGLNIEATILDLSCASLIIGLGSQWLSKVGISCLTLGLAWDGLRRFSEKVFHQNLRIGWTCYAADMGHCLLRITRSFHLLPPAYIILPFFIRFQRSCPQLFLLRFGNMQEISDIKATWWNSSYNDCKCLLLLTIPNNAMRCVWKFSPRHEIWL